METPELDDKQGTGEGGTEQELRSRNWPMGNEQMAQEKHEEAMEQTEHEEKSETKHLKINPRTEKKINPEKTNHNVQGTSQRILSLTNPLPNTGFI